MITPTNKQLDALKKVVNIGIEKAASKLNELLGSHIEMEAPSIIVFDPEKPGEEFTDMDSSKLASVQRGFYGSFSGSSVLVFPSESAVKLVAALTDEKPGTEGFDKLKVDTLNEVGNILINSFMGTINNLLSTHIDFLLPNYIEGNFIDLLKHPDSKEIEMFLLIRTNFKVRDPQVNGEIFLIFEPDSIKDLLNAIDKLETNIHK